MICTIKLMSKRIYTLHHNASEIGTPDIHRCNRVHKYATIARVQTSLLCAHAPHTMMMWIVILVSISLLAWFCSRAAAAVACIRWRWRHRTRENKRTHNRTPRASCCIYKYILCTELCDVVGEWKWKIQKKVLHTKIELLFHLSIGRFHPFIVLLILCALCASCVCRLGLFIHIEHCARAGPAGNPCRNPDALFTDNGRVSYNFFFLLLLSHCSVWRCSPVTMRAGVMSSLPSDFGHCHFISLKCFSPSSTFSSAFSSQSIFWLYTSLHTQRMVARVRMLCTIWRLTVATRLIATLICSCSHSQPVNWHTLIGHLVSVKSFMLRK